MRTDTWRIEEDNRMDLWNGSESMEVHRHNRSTMQLPTTCHDSLLVDHPKPTEGNLQVTVDRIPQRGMVKAMQDPATTRTDVAPPVHWGLFGNPEAFTMIPPVLPYRMYPTVGPTPKENPARRQSQNEWWRQNSNWHVPHSLARSPKMGNSFI